jgi:phage repressor protein C with HTH and peptisase S24 domain
MQANLGIVVVRGRSMLPTLREGDRLLVQYGVLPRPGQLGIVTLPGGVVSVKRLELADDTGYWFSRDNPAEGLDSWALGRGSRADEVLGTVRCRLWPRPARL